MIHRSQITSHLKAQRSQLGLDWLNFFIADVQTGFGPFIAVYLATQHFSPGTVGLVLAIGNIANVFCLAPGGALLDAVESKRRLIALALAALAASAATFAIWPRFWPVAIAEVVHGAATGVIQPALAALALGLVGHRALSRRLGRNQLYNSLGTAVTAAVMGAAGNFLSPAAPFLVAAAICVPAVLALALIRGHEIDYAKARSASDRNNPRKAHRVRDAARNRHLHIFFACLFLFELANAPLVPLASARLGYTHAGISELITSGIVVVPQVLTAVLAVWIARRAEDRGRKPLLLAGLGAVVVRAALFTVASAPWMLLPVQILDGLSAAVLGVMTPLVIADLVRGTGRYNLAQGTGGTISALGASASLAASGYVVEIVGYTGAFLASGAAALVGVALLWRFLPETRRER